MYSQVKNIVFYERKEIKIFQTGLSRLESAQPTDFFERAAEAIEWEVCIKSRGLLNDEWRDTAQRFLYSIVRCGKRRRKAYKEEVLKNIGEMD